jgi:hypothetical protein
MNKDILKRKFPIDFDATMRKQDDPYILEERAAILEYCAGLDRDTAERTACKQYLIIPEMRSGK